MSLQTKDAELYIYGINQTPVAFILRCPSVTKYLSQLNLKKNLIFFRCVDTKWKMCYNKYHGITVCVTKK